MLGKVLGLLLTLALLYAAEALLVYTINSIQDARGITTAFQSHTGLQEFQQSMLGLAAYMSWLAFGTALYLLLGMLLPRGFMLYSEMPRWDQSLAGADLFWLGMALIVCSILPYLYGRRTRRASWTRDCARRSRCFALAALCLMASGLLLGNPVASTNIQLVDPKAVLAALRSAPPPDPPWVRRTSGTVQNLNSVSCASSSTCIAAGDAGTILVTVDGGQSWQRRISGTINHLISASCSNDRSCVAVGYGDNLSIEPVILTTSNGGISWLIQHLGSYNYQLSVSCTSDGYCVSTGNYGEILARGTFGATWRSRASGTMDTLEGVSCWSIHQCVAVGVPVNATGGLNDTAVLLLNTHDGDNSWHGQPAGTSHGLNGVGCSIDGRCVAVGLGGTILGSSNGGASWAPQSSGTGRDLWGVSCQDRARCVVAGKGIILSTVDGGVSWHGRSPGTSWALAGASCPDADHCVLVGDNGVILTTSKFPF